MKKYQLSCPACRHNSTLKIETLSVSEQFQLYADNDQEVFRNLLEMSGLDNDSYEIRECQNCGLNFSVPMKGASGEWYSYAYNKLELHSSDRWEFDFVANTVTSHEKVGEIGCGTGVFLEKCKARGADVYGVDFSKSSIDVCKKKGLNATLIDIHASNVKLANGMNTLASFHVLEHLEDPNFLFRIASSCAASDATLWVSVPSDRRIDRLLKQKHLLDEPPHHLTKWTPKALSEIGQANGWYLKRMVDEDIDTRQSLYTFCINSGFYKSVMKPIGQANKWLDRTLRYAIYPFLFVWYGNKVIRLTGFAMMAEFKKAGTK
jgi:SAM-dependent methyltransferase